MWPAFPTSDYYASSVPSMPHPRSPRIARVRHGRGITGSHVPIANLQAHRWRALPLVALDDGRGRNPVVECARVAPSRGHVFCSFLALVLRKALQDRLEAKGHGGLEWARILDDLDALQEIEMTVGDKPYRLRTETKGTISAVFSACGVALPPTLQPG